MEYKSSQKLNRWFQKMKKKYKLRNRTLFTIQNIVSYTPSYNKYFRTQKTI